MAVIKLTKANFEAEALKSAKPVLVDFYADWCGPCKMVSPLVDELAEESDAYKVGKINVDESPELAAKYGVMSIPTLIVFKDGKVAQQAIGADYLGVWISVSHPWVTRIFPGSGLTIRDSAVMRLEPSV